MASSRSWVEKLVIALLVLLWISLIVGSRLVLGTHWTTDVIAGIIIGVLWLAVVIIALTRAEAIAARRQ